MLKDNITQGIWEKPANILHYAIFHAVHRMQYAVHKNGDSLKLIWMCEIKSNFISILVL